MFENIFGKKQNLSLLVDIGNGSIAGAIAISSPFKKTKILYCSRKAFDIVDIQSNTKLANNMYGLLNDILSDISKDQAKKHTKISNVVVSFSSPWIVLNTKLIHISEEKPFIVTEAFINDVINKEEVVFKNELESETLKSLHTNSIEVLDKTIVSSRLNDYSLKNIIGKKTNILDASVCLSAVSKAVAGKVRSIVSKHTGLSDEDISLHSFSLVSFLVIRDFFVSDNDFIIMDVTGETTDISLVQSGVLIKNTSFLSGRNFIIRQISKKLNISHKLAQSMFRLYMLEKIDDKSKDTVYEVLTDVEKEWSIYLEDALLDLSSNMVLPSKIFLTADDDVASFYSDCIKLPKTGLTLNFRKNANVIHINNEILSQIYECDPRVISDEFIGLLAVFLSKIIKK